MSESPECRLFPQGTQFSKTATGARAGRRGQQRPDQTTGAEGSEEEHTLQPLPGTLSLF